MTCEDCALLRVELEIAAVFVVVLGLFAGALYLILKVKDSIERKRAGRSSSSGTS